MSITHCPVPEHPIPLHPTNVEPSLGAAIRRTVALFGYPPAHVPDNAPPEMEHDNSGSASGAVTIPDPGPLPWSLNRWLGVTDVRPGPV